MKIEGHLFKNMPVYSRGGIAVSTLFKDCVTKNIALSLRVGNHNFDKIAKLLCFKGQIKTGLSSCFFKSRDCGKDGMLKRLSEFADLVGIGFNGLSDVSNYSNHSLEEWKNVEMCLQCEHSLNHVAIDSTCESHFCRHALNTARERTHQHDILS